MFRQWIMPAAAAGLVWVGSASAEGPSIEQVLSLRPSQSDVEFDTPGKSVLDRCKVETSASPRGWIVRDEKGTIVRQFIDSNGDNIVDRWSFFKNGQEVYRDSDTNGNGKPDLCQWFLSGGSRIGKDANEDGAIDGWVAISAEEATAEVLAGIVTKDANRIARVLVGDADAQALGLTDKAKQRYTQAQQKSMGAVTQMANALKGATWVRFDGVKPSALPGTMIDATKDVVAYTNSGMVIEVGGQNAWLRIPEIVRVGDTWKLTDLPTIVDPNQPAAITAVLIPAVEDNGLASNDSVNEGAMIEAGDKFKALIETLQKHDGATPDDGDAKAMLTYHLKRAEICAQIGAESQKLKNREHWYRQTADSLNAAVQTGQYPQGVQMLMQYGEQFGKTSWGGNLAAYFKYRGINADYALTLQKPGDDHVKAQEAFLERLVGFLKEHPDSPDGAEALWQLGSGMEFANKDEEAAAYYKLLAKKFPESKMAKKASGALRRIDSIGQPFQLTARNLTGQGTLNFSQLKGNVVLVSFWATWCEPCKQEMPRLKKLREKYGSKGLEIVGVNLDSEKTAAEAYVKQQGFAWPQLNEPGSLESGPAIQYGIISLPYMMLLDADGNVLNKNVQYNNLEAEIEKALVKKVASKKD